MSSWQNKHSQLSDEPGHLHYLTHTKMKKQTSGILAPIILLPVLLFSFTLPVSVSEEAMKMEAEFIRASNFDVEIGWDTKGRACMITAVGLADTGYTVKISNLEGKLLVQEHFEGSYIDMYFVSLESIEDQVIVISVTQAEEEVSAMLLRP